MGLNGESLSIFGILGVIIIGFIVILAVASFIMDYDPSTTIQNNTTIDLNGITLTVPKTENSTIDKNASLLNINESKKVGENMLASEVTAGTAYQYYDYENNLIIWVCDANSTSYTDEHEEMTIENSDGQLKRDFWQKRTIGNKTIVMYVTEGKVLSKQIIESARLT